MSKEINIIGFGMLPCLHCGDVVNMNKDIHLCNVPREEWLNQQEEAYIEMPDGGIWDLKNKKITALTERKSNGD